MKTIINGLSITIQESEKGFIATATIECFKVVQLSCESTRDYAAIAGVCDAIKKHAVETYKNI